MLALLGLTLLTLPEVEEARATSEAPGLVRLWIDSNVPDVEIRDGPGRAATVVCKQPCGVTVDPRSGARLMLASSRLNVQEPLALGDYGGDVTAVVDGGSVAGQGFGVLLVFAGVLAAVAGLSEVGDYDGSPLPFLMGGAALSAGGVALAVSSGPTFELRPGRR
jgi:hypothetical protein